MALILLALGFIGCYALPPLLPYGYNDLDYDALLQPPSLKHWFGTNALGQDLLARTLRGMQKSMLIGFCVALISTSVAATVGSVAGYFGGWRDRSADVAGGPAAGGAELPADRHRHPAHQTVEQHSVAHRAARGVRLDGQLADGARLDDEPARTRIRPCGKVYGGVEPSHYRASHRAERRLDPHHRRHAQRRIRDPGRNQFELPGIRCSATRRVAGHADRRRHSLGHHVPVGLPVPGRRRWY